MRAAAALLVLFPWAFLSAPAAAEMPAFTEISAEAGLDFNHFNGASGEYYFAVTAYDSQFNESALSEELFVEITETGPIVLPEV